MYVVHSDCYKNNKKSEQFFCKLPNLDGQTTLPKKSKQFDFGTRFLIVLEYSPTPPGVVRDGGRDGRPAAQTRSLPIQKRPITTTNLQSHPLTQKPTHSLLKLSLLSNNPPLPPSPIDPKK